MSVAAVRGCGCGGNNKLDIAWPLLSEWVWNGNHLSAPLPQRLGVRPNKRYIVFCETMNRRTTSLGLEAQCY